MAPRGPVRVAICGPPGAGKTALARAAASAAGVGPVGHGADFHARRHHSDGWGRNARSTAPPATIPAHVAGPDDDDDRAVMLLDTPGWAPSSGGGGGANGTVPTSCPPLASLVPHLRGVARDADVVVLAYDAGGTTREVTERIDALSSLWLPALREALQRPRRRARRRSGSQPSEMGDNDDEDDEGTRRIPVVVAGCRRDARRGEDAGGRTPVTNGANGVGRSDDDAGRADGAPSADKPKKPKPNLKPNPKTAAPGASNDANGGGGGGGDDDDVDVEAALLALMDAWREIESCVECSARTGFNALKTVRLARRGAIFPVAPLLRTQPSSRDPSSSPGAAELSARCTRALADVFHAHDVDGDGALADVDLVRMQRRAFGVAPAPGELDGLKRTCADATNGAGVVTLDGDHTGLTLRGFLYAHGLFVAKGRAETTWTLLRAHGYDDDLEPIVDDGEAGEDGEEAGDGDGEARGFPSKTPAVDVATYLAAGAVLAGAAVFAFRTTGGRDARLPGGFITSQCFH